MFCKKRQRDGWISVVAAGKREWIPKVLGHAASRIESTNRSVYFPKISHMMVLVIRFSRNDF
jgi:hypothetical protein